MIDEKRISIVLHFPDQISSRTYKKNRISFIHNWIHYNLSELYLLIHLKKIIIFNNTSIFLPDLIQMNSKHIQDNFGLFVLNNGILM